MFSRCCFSAVCITADSPVFAYRERNLQNRFVGGFNPDHPNLMGATGPHSEHQAGLDWEDIAWVRETTKLPLILKGVLTTEDAVLAVIELTDEDDCSASDLALFDTAAPEYTPNINLRCTEHPEALQALARFRDGLLALKADPTQVVFTTISGIPVDLQGATYADMLADPRMQLTPDPDNSTQLLPACETPNGIAYPSRRLIGMAQELESAGAKTAVTSICDAEFDGAVAVILEQVAAGVSGSCE